VLATHSAASEQTHTAHSVFALTAASLRNDCAQASYFGPAFNPILRTMQRAASRAQHKLLYNPMTVGAARCLPSRLPFAAHRPRGVGLIAGATTRLQFTLTKQLPYGMHIAVVGCGDGLGNWDAKSAPALKWTEGHKWVSDELEVPEG
jgi:hypothetical protein